MSHRQTITYTLEDESAPWADEWYALELELDVRFTTYVPATWTSYGGDPPEGGDVDEMDVKVVGAHGFRDEPPTEAEIVVLQAQLDAVLAVDGDLVQKLDEYCIEHAEEPEPDYYED